MQKPRYLTAGSAYIKYHATQKKKNASIIPACLWSGCHKQLDPAGYRSDHQASGKPAKEKLQYFDFKLLLAEEMPSQSQRGVNEEESDSKDEGGVCENEKYIS